MGGRTDAMYINDAVDADLGDLAHVVDAAEFLGLLKASGGDLELTAAGRDAVERPLREFQKYLKRRLSEVEPFASLARFVSERGRVEVGEVLEFLSSFGYGEEGFGLGRLCADCGDRGGRVGGAFLDVAVDLV